MNTSYQKIFQASILVAVSGILYGFLGFLGTNLLQDHMTISDMLFWRFIIAGIWMLLFTLRKHATHKIMHGINKQALFYMFILGALGYAGSSGFYFMASKHTGTGLAMVIFFSYPMIVAISSWIINRENFNFITGLTLLMMTVGLVLLKDTSGQAYNLIGIFFAILAAICYAGYVIGSKKFSSTRIDSNILATIVCFGCALLYLTLTLSTHGFTLPHTTKSWTNLLALGILATAIPIQLMLEGLKYVSSIRASIISVLEPLITVIVGILLLGESISHVQLLGVLIILGSATAVQFHKKL